MNTLPPASRTDWLNLARENAAVFADGGGDASDLGRAIVRLATLAAAAHRAEHLAAPAAAGGLASANGGLR